MRPRRLSKAVSFDTRSAPRTGAASWPLWEGGARAFAEGREQIVAGAAEEKVSADACHPFRIPLYVCCPLEG